MREEICPECKRVHHVLEHSIQRPWCGDYATVSHQMYGCDCDCCGHKITLFNNNGAEVASEFVFSHPFDTESAERIFFIERVIQSQYPGVHIRFDLCDISDL